MEGQGQRPSFRARVAFRCRDPDRLQFPELNLENLDSVSIRLPASSVSLS